MSDSKNGQSCILKCNESMHDNPRVTLHKFPKNESQRQKWLDACGFCKQDVIGNKKICSLHFEPDCYIKGRNILKPCVVPTIFTNVDVIRDQKNAKPKNKTRTYNKKQSDRCNMKTVSFQKLVVSKSMHSPYRKYFEFPASDNCKIFTQNKIICILCKKQFAFENDTTNLRMHLKSRHKIELTKLELDSCNDGIPRKQYGINEPTILATSESKTDVNNSKYRGNQYVYTQEKINENYENEHVTTVHDEISQISVIFQDIENSPCDMISKVVSDAITNFVITDLHSPDIVEGKGFQRLIANLRMAPCEIPGKLKLEQDIIPRIYESSRTSVLNTIVNNYSTFSLGIEEWTSSSSNVYVSISVFLQQTDKKDLCVKQLATIICNPKRTADEWSEIMEGLFINWCINVYQVKTVIKAFTNRELEEALQAQGFILIPCLIYELQKLCTKYCFETKEVSDVLTKCRALLAKLNNHNALTSITVQDNAVQVFNSCFGREYPPIWTTTYHYLECFVKSKERITNVSNSLNKLFYPNEELLTDEDWSIIEDVISTLEPLKVTVTTLCEEKIPFISLLKPLINQLTNYHLKVNPNDSELAASLKTKIASELYWKYNDNNVWTFLHISTLLDPRFKDFPLAKWKEYLPIIQQEFLKIVENDRFLTYDSNSSDFPEILSEESKNSKVSSIGYLLGSVETLSVVNKKKLPIADQLNLEISQYKSEKNLCLEECPLLWWSRMSSKYQNLIRLVRKQFVYALSGLPSKLPIDLQVLYYIRRSKINDELVDKLTFINSNSKENISDY